MRNICSVVPVMPNTRQPDSCPHVYEDAIAHPLYEGNIPSKTYFIRDQRWPVKGDHGGDRESTISSDKQ